MTNPTQTNLNTCLAWVDSSASEAASHPTEEKVASASSGAIVQAPSRLQNLIQRSVSYIAYLRGGYPVCEDMPDDEPWEEVSSAAPNILSFSAEMLENMQSEIVEAARCAKLAYELPREVTSVKLDDKEFSVNFLRRRSGLTDVKGNPALCLTNENGKMMISVPGTVTVNDWASNLSADVISLDRRSIFTHNCDDHASIITGKIAVHSGFYFVALSIIDDLNKQINQAREQGAIQTITISGHSQGGAVAQILSLYIATHKRHLQLADDIPLLCITFASPRVFTKETYDFFIKHVPYTFNLSHPADIVPKFPLGASGFRHMGFKISMPTDVFRRTVVAGAEEDLAQSVQLDLDAVSRVSSFAFKIFQPTSWHSCITEAHSMENYLSMCSCIEGMDYIKQTLQGRQLAIDSAARIEEISSQQEDDTASKDAQNGPVMNITVRFTPGRNDSDEGELSFEGEHSPI
jgi:hypothetical protein